MNRRKVVYASIAVDAIAVVLAGVLAFWVRFDWLAPSGPRVSIKPDWSLVVVLAVTLLSFLSFGLYGREAYLLRTLHVWMIVRATTVAFVVTAVIVYLLKSPVVQQSRLVLVVTFAAFGVLDVAGRLLALTPLVFGHLRRCQGATLVVAAPGRSAAIVSRLETVRGFADVRVLDIESQRAGHVALGALERDLDKGEPGVVENLFIDPTGLPTRLTLDVVQTAKERGVEVYVLSALLSPLDSTRLLLELFEAPTMRVQLHPAERRVRASKRAFDIAGAGLALLLLAPLLAVIAALIKLTSAGPVLFTQERVGLRGRPFKMFKLRSMVVDGDTDAHRSAARRFVSGQFAPNNDGAGEALPFKLSGDPRITRVGRFIRKFSLDEVPQFWNVLMGDMSLVGPRPALAYEVETYEDWHHERLTAVPGLSGLWQVSGRSRVDFDEMVLEDVLYTYNQSVLTDLGICLRTIPVVIFGRGAV